MHVIDVMILKILKSENATDVISGLAIKDFPMEDMMLKYNSLYKRVKRLMEAGYVDAGFRDGHADTYYITESGLKLLMKNERGELT